MSDHSKKSLRVWLRLLGSTMLVEKTLQQRLTTQFATTLPRFDILSALNRHPEGMSMSELSRALLVSNGNVTGLITRLSSDGLVERMVDANDRRSCIVKLSQAGERQFRKWAQAHESWLDELFSTVPDDDLDHLLGSLNSLRRGLAEQGL